jgi:hypothetical protein
MMCGTLKFNDTRHRLGGNVTARVYRSGDTIKGKWTGFIKQEHIGWWMDQAALTPVEIVATTFIEGKVEFAVPTSKILGYQLGNDVFFGSQKIGSAGDIKILTRAPMNRFEGAIHGRWPVVKVGKKRQIFAFQPWDVNTQNKPLQIPLL